MMKTAEVRIVVRAKVFHMGVSIGNVAVETSPQIYLAILFTVPAMLEVQQAYFEKIQEEATLNHLVSDMRLRFDRFALAITSDMPNAGGYRTDVERIHENRVQVTFVRSKSPRDRIVLVTMVIDDLSQAFQGDVKGMVEHDRKL